jgi:rhodanese-related sulfurtransferase
MRIAMRIRFVSTILSIATIAIAATLAATTPAHAFDLSKMLGNPEPIDSANTLKIIDVKGLAQEMADPKSDVVVYDANHPDTRTKYGIIPGAHLLPSADGFSVSQELPANKDANLVFYCANTQCMASHEAARRAIDAGYKDVSVMSDGIMGWKKAGQPTASVTNSKVGNS